MSAFGGLKLTQKGIDLQAKAQIGAELEYTRIGIGDGNYTGEILVIEDLVHQVMSLSISSLSVNGGVARIGSALSNQDLTEGVYLREIGIFATDSDDGEILYAYANAGAYAGYIPPAGGGDVIEKEIELLTTVGIAGSVTATIDSSVFVTVGSLDQRISLVLEELDAHMLETTAHGATSAAMANRLIVRDESGRAQVEAPVQEADIAQKGNVDAVQVNLNVHTTNTTNPHNVTKTQVGLSNVDNVKQAPLSTYTTHLADYIRQPGFGTTSGGANSYTLTLTPALSAYAEGVAIAVKIHATNTGVSTINVNGLGTRALRDSEGNEFAAGTLKVNMIYTFRMGGTVFLLQGKGGDLAKVHAGTTTIKNTPSRTFTYNGTGRTTSYIDIPPPSGMSYEDFFSKVKGIFVSFTLGSTNYYMRSLDNGNGGVYYLVKNDSSNPWTLNNAGAMFSWASDGVTFIAIPVASTTETNLAGVQATYSIRYAT